MEVSMKKMKKWCKAAGMFTLFGVLSLGLSGCGKDGGQEKETDTPPQSTEFSENTEKQEAVTEPTEDGRKDKEEVPKASDLFMDPSEYPIVDGSTATIPLSEALYRLLTGASEEEAKSAVYHTTTGNAYARLIQGEADLLIVYEGSEDVMKWAEESGIQKKPVGKDALIFMTNSENPVESLTEEELVGIYSGAITNWSELGGEEKEILAFQRPAGSSGSQALMQKLVMGDTPLMEGDNVIRFETMSDILEGMLTYSNGTDASTGADTAYTLGYSVFYYAGSMYRLPGLRFMKVNQVEPSVQSIYDGSYPYVQDFYVAIRKDEPADSKAGMMYRFLTGDEGQQLVQDCGYVPITMQEGQGTAEEEPPETVEYRLNNGEIYVAYSPVYTDWDRRMGTVIVLDESMRQVQRIANAYTGDTGVHQKDGTIVLGTAEQTEDGYRMKYGLYDLASGDYVIPPNYEDISVLDEEKGFYLCEVSYGYYQVLNRDQKVVLDQLVLGEGYYLKQTGEYYWVYTLDSEAADNTSVYRIYDKNLKLTAEYEADELENTIMSPSGEILLNEKLLQEKYGAGGQILSYIFPGAYEEGVSVPIAFQSGDEIFIVDRNTGLLGTFSADEYEKKEIQCFGACWSAKGENESRIYSAYDGRIIEDENGTAYPYLSILGDMYYFAAPDESGLKVQGYRAGDGTLKKTGQEYRFELKDRFESFYAEEEGLFVIDVTVTSAASPGTSVGKKSIVFHNNEKLIELDGHANTSWYQDSVNGSVAVVRNSYEPDAEFCLIKDGKLRYRSGSREQFLRTDGALYQAVRGNYYVVCDIDGNVVYREPAGELEFD